MSRYVFKLGETVLPHNPESIVTKKTSDGDVQILTIEAHGELAGADRGMYYNKLNECLSKGKSVTVCMPEFGVVNARISELVFSVSDIPMLTSYSIKLRAEYGISDRICKGYTLEAQETLWSLCDRLNLDLEIITPDPVAIDLYSSL